jgi:ABC-type transport system involved in multi-copper enzyme maturation permease subunit
MGVWSTGIDPIRYKPWSGERAGTRDRVLIIVGTLFRQKLKSKWVLAFLILGIILVFVFPIIFGAMVPHETLDAEIMAFQMGSQQFFVFTILLVALICADSIAEDLRSSSFVLYFSRAIKAEGYLTGKMGGTILALSLFCFIPPIIMAIVLMGTQSGPDYIASLGILGRTVIAGLVATSFFIPFSMLISSLTTRKSYAAVGTFVTFFVLTIISFIFTEFHRDWELINPGNVMAVFYDWLYGLGIPSDTNIVLFLAMFIGFTFLPLGLLYLRIRMKAVGK